MTSLNNNQLMHSASPYSQYRGGLCRHNTDYMD